MRKRKKRLPFRCREVRPHPKTKPVEDAKEDTRRGMKEPVIITNVKAEFPVGRFLGRDKSGVSRVKREASREHSKMNKKGETRGGAIIT